MKRNNAESERESLRGYAKAQGLTPTTWEREAGLGDGTLTKWLRTPGASLSRPNLNKLADWYNEKYGTSLSGMDLIMTQPKAAIEAQSRSKISETADALQVDPMLPPVTLWRSSPGVGEKKLGGWMLSVADAGTAPRPDTMRYTVLANGFKVLDKKNDPVYCYKDTVLIDRDLPGEEGEDCAFTGEPQSDGPIPVILGKLITNKEAHWVITQYAAVDEPLNIPKSDYPNAWPIVARYHRR